MALSAMAKHVFSHRNSFHNPVIFVVVVYSCQKTYTRRPIATRTSAVDTPVRFLCLKNLANMLEKEGDEARALELYVAAAEEDQSDLGV